jgi:ABC-2 type transport system permease protein
MSRALARIALREHRRGLIGFVAFAVVMMLLQGVGFAQVAGSTPAQRLQFAQTESLLGAQFTWLYPEPLRIETLGGYLQWHVFSVTIVVLAVWAVFLGVAAMRRGEEKGLLDMWLGAGVSRLRMMLVRAAAGIGVLAMVAVAACVGVVAGAAMAGEAVDALGLAGIGLSLWATTCVCFALALLLSQVVAGRRVATGIGAAVVVALFLVNGFSRQLEGLRGVGVLSPFHWYDRATALAPGASYDASAPLILLVATVVLVALAALALLRRDIGGALVRPRVRARAAVLTPSRNPMLRLPVLSSLYRDRWSTLAWSLGTAIGALFLAGVAKPAAEILDKTPQLREFLPQLGHGAGTAQLYVGFAWFGLAALISAAFAISAVARWTADDLEGRLAAELSAPVSRSRVVVERMVTLAAGLGILSAVDAAAVLLGVAWFGVSLDTGGVVVAAALLVPLGMVFAAAGGVLSALLPRGTVTVLSGLAVVSYLLFTLGPMFKLPAWVLDLSMFQLYGTPLVEGLFVAGLVALLATAGAGIAGSLAAFQRREVGG